MDIAHIRPKFFSEIDFLENSLPKVLLSLLNRYDVQRGQDWYQFFRSIRDEPSTPDYMKLLIFYAQHGRLDGPFSMDPPPISDEAPLLKIPKRIDVMNIACYLLEREMNEPPIPDQCGKSSKNPKNKYLAFNQLSKLDLPSAFESDWYREPDLDQIANVLNPIYLSTFLKLKSNPETNREMFYSPPEDTIVIYGDCSIRSKRRGCTNIKQISIAGSRMEPTAEGKEMDNFGGDPMAAILKQMKLGDSFGETENHDGPNQVAPAPGKKNSNRSTSADMSNIQEPYSKAKGDHKSSDREARENPKSSVDDTKKNNPNIEDENDDFDVDESMDEDIDLNGNEPEDDQADEEAERKFWELLNDGNPRRRANADNFYFGNRKNSLFDD